MTSTGSPCRYSESGGCLAEIEFQKALGQREESSWGAAAGLFPIAMTPDSPVEHHLLPAPVASGSGASASGPEYPLLKRAAGVNPCAVHDIVAATLR